MSLEEELKADNFIIISNSLLLEARHYLLTILYLVPIVCKCNPISLQFISVTKLMQAQLEDAVQCHKLVIVQANNNTKQVLSDESYAKLSFAYPAAV